MKKGTIVGLSILGVVAILIIGIVGWGVSAYNNLVTKETEITEQYSNIQSQLQRRSDLIPNLVASVKGYAAHEEEIFKAVSDARAKLAGSTTVADQAHANNELTSALNRLMVVVENYPDLKADANFRGLQDELAGTENRINTERIKYNEIVKEYNVLLKRFPSSIIAGMFNMEPADSFTASAGADEVPKVEF